mmetsp:Transcript_141269/g.451510  ORF Transcript_141269/g.451510 Transcript_141269/m.451510 type:complete len:190 (-) Transcript_141269:106-675(-)
MESACAMLECNICLEPAAEPVLTRCGHIFCWSCLHQWLSTPRRSPATGGLLPSTGSSPCPVCKAGVSAQTVTPVYARGTGGGSDATEEHPSRRLLRDPSLPSRPQAERPEMPEPASQEEQGAFVYGGTAARYGFSAGYGQFPVLVALAAHSFQGSGFLSSVLDIPMTSRKAKLVVFAIAGAAVVSMALM